MSNKISPLYGWWSNEQSIIGGWSTYTTAEGYVIKCSMVSGSPEHDTIWTDMQPLGVVVEFLEHYDAKGKLTSQSNLARKMYGDRLVNDCEPASAAEFIEFITFKGLTTKEVGRA